MCFIMQRLSLSISVSLCLTLSYSLFLSPSLFLSLFRSFFSSLYLPIYLSQSFSLILYLFLALFLKKTQTCYPATAAESCLMSFPKKFAEGDSNSVNSRYFSFYLFVLSFSNPYSTSILHSHKTARTRKVRRVESTLVPGELAHSWHRNPQTSCSP